MKLPSFLLSLSVIGACGVQDGGRQNYLPVFQADHKQEIHRYAHYRFMHDEFQDIDVVIKVVIVDGTPTIMYLQDLAPESPPGTVTEIPLWVAAEYPAAHDPDTQVIDFGGRSAGEEVYTGELTVSGGRGSACCGKMSFIPSSADPQTVFIGSFTNDSNETEWQALTTSDPGNTPASH